MQEMKLRDKINQVKSQRWINHKLCQCSAVIQLSWHLGVWIGIVEHPSLPGYMSLWGPVPAIKLQKPDSNTEHSPKSWNSSSSSSHQACAFTITPWMPVQRNQWELEGRAGLHCSFHHYCRNVQICPVLFHFVFIWWHCQTFCFIQFYCWHSQLIYHPFYAISMSQKQK